MQLVLVHIWRDNLPKYGRAITKSFCACYSFGASILSKNSLMHLSTKSRGSLFLYKILLLFSLSITATLRLLEWRIFWSIEINIVWIGTRNLYLWNFAMSHARLIQLALRENCLNTEFFLVRILPHSDWLRRNTPFLSVFSPNAGK